MFKLFFIITLASALVIWYIHEYHPVKFSQFIQNIPVSSEVISQIHSYFLTSSPVSSSFAKVFTKDELMEYNGEKDSKGLYLAILGEVYDVGRGRRHYGPGGPYHVFAGRDASRSFVTGDFENGNPIDDVLDLSLSEMLSLRDWTKFYRKEYDYKGKVAGRYYDKEGRKTEYWEKVQKKFNEAEKTKKGEKEEETLFPPCNVEWNAETGTKVWCSKKSGGIQRNWIGVPRKLYQVGSESYRCACVDTAEVQKPNSLQHARRGHLQQYENCDPLQHFCFIKE